MMASKFELVSGHTHDPSYGLHLTLYFHGQYKNGRGDGPSRGCFIYEFEADRTKEQEKKMARHLEEKWEDIRRKAEFHPKAKVRWENPVDAKPMC